MISLREEGRRVQKKIIVLVASWVTQWELEYSDEEKSTYEHFTSLEGSQG